MIRRRGATSNTERQRAFRRRHPGYYGRYHAKQRSGKETAAAIAAAEHLAAVQAMLAKPQPLMLPAPVVLVEIPGMTIPATSAIPAHAAIPVPVSQQATLFDLMNAK